MPLVCIQRPNRKEARRWTPEAVARVAKYAADDGHGVLWILGIVAASLGLGVLVCKLASSIKDTLTVFRFLRELAAALVVAQALRVLIERIKRGPILRVPLVNRLVIAALLVIVVIEKLLAAIGGAAGALGTLEQSVRFVNDLCAYVTNGALVLGDKAREQIEDVKDVVR